MSAQTQTKKTKRSRSAESLDESRGVEDTTTTYYPPRIDDLDIEETAFTPRVEKLTLPIMAALLNTAIIVLLVLVVFVDVPLTKEGPLSHRRLQVYITGLTLAATLATKFILGQIKLLWLDEAERPQQYRSSDYELARKKKKETLFGVSSTSDGVTFWRVSVTFLVVGLITTAIVGGLTPGNRVKERRYGSVRTSSDFWTVSDIPYGDDVLNGVYYSNGTDGSPYAWRNGTRFYRIPIKGEADGTSGSTKVLGFEGDYDDLFHGQRVSIAKSMLDIKTITSDFRYLQGKNVGGASATTPVIDGNYSYVQEGVLVRKDAIGIPRFSLQDIATSSENLYLTEAEVCFPVVIANPVKCFLAGNVTVNAGASLLTVEAEGCKVTRKINSCDLSEHGGGCGATVSGVCAGGKVGEVTVVMGSVGEHATWLQKAVRAPSITPVSVACRISRPSFAFRTVVVSRLEDWAWRADVPQEAKGIVFTARAKPGAAPCVPKQVGPFDQDLKNLKDIKKGDFFDDLSYATAAAASWYWLSENRYSDGSWETMHKAVGSLSSLYIFPALRPGVSYDQSVLQVTRRFEDSQNHMEDALGVITAQGLGERAVINGSDSISNAILRYQALKVGGNSKLQLLYTIPCVFSLAVLVSFIWRRGKLSDINI